MCFVAAPAAAGAATAGYSAATYAAIAAMVAATAMSAYSAQQQAKMQKQVGEYNAKMNEFAAQDAEKRGDKQANDLARQMSALEGAQRSRMAAAGLDLSEGTAGDIQDQTDFFKDRDVATLRFNGRKDAFNARQTGTLARWQGDAQASQSQLSSYGTLLGGSAQVADKWYTMTKTPTATGG